MPGARTSILDAFVGGGPPSSAIRTGGADEHPPRRHIALHPAAKHQQRRVMLRRLRFPAMEWHNATAGVEGYCPYAVRRYARPDAKSSLQLRKIRAVRPSRDAERSLPGKIVTLSCPRRNFGRADTLETSIRMIKIAKAGKFCYSHRIAWKVRSRRPRRSRKIPNRPWAPQVSAASNGERSHGRHRSKLRRPYLWSAISIAVALRPPFV